MNPRQSPGSRMGRLTLMYTHCSSHNLNMCLSDVGKIPFMRNHIGTISEVCFILHASQKDSKSQIGYFIMLFYKTLNVQIKEFADKNDFKKEVSRTGRLTSTIFLIY